jgi:hypothetical protein
MRGIILWSLILGYAFWRAPRALPHSVKLARIAVICGFVGIASALYLKGAQEARGWFLLESGPMTILVFVGGVGILSGLICGAIAFFIDAKRTPSPR